ncbi:LysM peptidoglycan-binding domain-containing protein [Nocardia veterana]|uniref:LysM peptidoglycan-binding domain-containing protein n=1 Tax=Nocardia veterana TaxID=132249 RepID=A0A7X6M279_9NOCA|nr:LysM peptidoglycan-binding domain-containing protein [Nocardia veterana]NKY88871.1 LysM peptidoglycan-binding domain-containing protein [Nocardia veterana]
MALRTAEQTFLPLISRIAKLRQYVDESGLAIQDAKAVGVTAEQLEDTLRGIARKTDVRYDDIPETVRATIAAPAEAGAAVPAPRARLALRTVEQTFLPLVSRFAKLRAYVDEAVLAVADARAAGVDGEHLEDTLRSIARKNGTSYNDIPAAVRAAISDD